MCVNLFSAVWMAYRCGWTTLKDDNQSHVLALRLSRPALESLLSEVFHAQLQHQADPRAPVVQWVCSSFVKFFPIKHNS